MKKMLLWSFVFFFGLAPVAFAQGFVPLAPIPGLTEGATTNPAGLATFFNNLYKYLIGLAAVLAVIQITWAGLDIAIFHKDAVGAITDDKGKIYNAIFGLILVLSPVLVFSIINPSILNLSINLPELKTAPRTSNTTGDATNGVQPPARDTALTTATSAGCVIVTSNPQVLSCPDQASAQAFVDNCVKNGGTGDVSSLLISSKYQATCSTPVTTACTLARSGPYLETAVCASLFPDATSYKCTNGLTLKVPPCKTSNTNGTCADTSVTVYCSGKSTTIGVYEYYTATTNWTGFGKSNATILPSDKATYDAFVSACQNDGGKTTTEITTESSFFLSSRGYLVSNGCSSNAGIPPFNTNQYSGVRCFNNTLSCNPPQ